MEKPASELAVALGGGQAAPFTTSIIGHPIDYVPTVGSTQHLVHERARQGAAEGLVVVSDEQTAGRGRLDRSWRAPFGTSLLMSILLRPNLAAVEAARLTMCAGLGAAEGLEAVSGLTIGLKWPNDLFLDGKKLAGILTETELEHDRLRYAVLGIGINVNVVFAPQDELAATATSLAMALGHPLDRLDLLRAVLQRIDYHYAQLKTGHSPYSLWTSRLVHLGQQVAVHMPEATLTGVAVGVDENGALLLEDSTGRQRAVWAGDVVALQTQAGQARNLTSGNHP